MESTIRQYNISIFPCQETWDASGAAVCLFEEETSCIPIWQTGTGDFDFAMSDGRNKAVCNNYELTDKNLLYYLL